MHREAPYLTTRPLDVLWMPYVMGFQLTPRQELTELAANFGARTGEHPGNIRGTQVDMASLSTQRMTLRLSQ